MQTQLESKHAHTYKHSSIINANMAVESMGASITNNIASNMTQHIVKYPSTNTYMNRASYINDAQEMDYRHSTIAESKTESNHKAQQSLVVYEIQITVENRIFSLNLENLGMRCRDTITRLFKDKNYSLEELLVLFLTNIRDQSLAEIELDSILQSLKSSNNSI
ncbi:hypothetical protein LS73_009505 [Helicobacter muridarum]|uniref:Uncharacterized protein n=1 Tax=Helicobacter muridarum TaxID=216 RepID=A0A377PW51_9HELI|nr:hypothetical protein [Helicobacter muridarum]TLD98031.1 hypothetical protein LS73_009505 [Helicobacter muridarum]STQ87106.1 Uncharacterised protein [Helicobacter muridarum]